MLPAFATVADLAARRPLGVSDGERARAQAALDDASALIRAEINNDWTTGDPPALKTDTPAIFLTVACSAAKRAIDNPDGIQSEALAVGYSVTLANSSSDVYLTKAEKALIRKAAGLNEVFALSTTRDPDGLGLETGSVRCDTGNTVYLPTDPPGDPMPWTSDLG